MSFWLRRWIEQSRSNRCTTLPKLSPRICASMCLGLTMHFSRKTSAEPKALVASEITRGNACSSSSRELQRRMPRPPPPLVALSITG
ncbi:hypothetical protein D3C85_1384600 [compost metagenome]